MMLVCVQILSAPPSSSSFSSVIVHPITSITMISDTIFSECISCNLCDSSTIICYKLAFSRENFNISILEHDLKYCLEHVKSEPLSIYRQSLLNCLQELSLAKVDN